MFMKLDAYLSEKKISAAQFASMIKAKSKATVHRYITGARFPSREMLHNIHDATGGSVTANDFYLSRPNTESRP